MNKTTYKKLIFRLPEDEAQAFNVCLAFNKHKAQDILQNAVSDYIKNSRKNINIDNIKEVLGYTD